MIKVGMYIMYRMINCKKIQHVFKKNQGNGQEVIRIITETMCYMFACMNVLVVVSNWKQIYGGKRLNCRKLKLKCHIAYFDPHRTVIF